MNQVVADYPSDIQVSRVHRSGNSNGTCSIGNILECCICCEPSYHGIHVGLDSQLVEQTFSIGLEHEYRAWSKAMKVKLSLMHPFADEHSDSLCRHVEIPGFHIQPCAANVGKSAHVSFDGPGKTAGLRGNLDSADIEIVDFSGEFPFN